MHPSQEWTGKFFTKITLKDLGLRFQLGHAARVVHYPLADHPTSWYLTPWVFITLL